MDPAKLDKIQDALVRADLGYDPAHRVTTVSARAATARASRPTR